MATKTNKTHQTRGRRQSKIQFVPSNDNPKQSGSQAIEANISTMDAGSSSPNTDGGENRSNPVLDAIKDLKTEFSSRFDGVLAAIAGIRKEVDDCVARVTDTETRISDAEDTVNSLKSKVLILDKTNKELEAKVLGLETRSRRSNLRLLNVSEKTVADKDLCSFLENWIPKTFDVTLTSKAFLGRVHRLGQKSDPSGRPRTIIMQFLNDRDMMEVWNAARTKGQTLIEEKPVWFHRDLPTDTYKKLKGFDAARKRLRAMKVRCGMQLPACKLLVTHLDQTHLFEDPADAEAFAGGIDSTTDGTRTQEEEMGNVDDRASLIAC